MESARILVDCLKRYKEEFNWDLAEIALSQSEAVLKPIEDALARRGGMGMHQTASPMNLGTGIDDSFWDNPLLQYQGFGWEQPEELFPGLFSDLSAESTLFEPLADM